MAACGAGVFGPVMGTAFATNHRDPASTFPLLLDLIVPTFKRMLTVVCTLKAGFRVGTYRDAWEVGWIRGFLVGSVCLFITSLFLINVTDEDKKDLKFGGVLFFIFSICLLIAALYNSRCFNVFRPSRTHFPDEMDPGRLLSLSPLDYIFTILGCKERRVGRSQPVRFENCPEVDVLD